MALKLYELVAGDGRPFSPYCWRIRMALANKGLTAEFVPIRFSDKPQLAFSGQDRVPVLVDGRRTISDSWAIACHIERYYPTPPLFGNGQANGMCRFINEWADRVLLPGIGPLIILDIFNHVHPDDREYFRSSREKRFGRTLEEIQADRETRVEDFRRTLAPLRTRVKDQPFVSGDFPGYADHVVFGGFQWARAISDFPLLSADDPINTWRRKMLGLFDGLAAKAPGYDW